MLEAIGNYFEWILVIFLIFFICGVGYPVPNEWDLPPSPSPAILYQSHTIGLFGWGTLSHIFPVTFGG